MRASVSTLILFPLELLFCLAVAWFNDVQELALFGNVNGQRLLRRVLRQNLDSVAPPLQSYSTTQTTVLQRLTVENVDAIVGSQDRSKAVSLRFFTDVDDVLHFSSDASAGVFGAPKP